MSADDQQTNKTVTGRPRVEIDLHLLEALSEAGCSEAEVAAMLRRQDQLNHPDDPLAFSLSTVKRRLKEAVYKEAWETGVLVGKAKLRLQQVKLSKLMNSAGVQMSIHLGKHWLDQHDRVLSLNVSIEDLNRIIAELEQRALATAGGQSAGHAGDDRPTAALAGPEGAPAANAKGFALCKRDTNA